MPALKNARGGCRVHSELHRGSDGSDVIMAAVQPPDESLPALMLFEEEDATGTWSSSSRTRQLELGFLSLVQVGRGPGGLGVHSTGHALPSPASPLPASSWAPADVAPQSSTVLWALLLSGETPSFPPRPCTVTTEPPQRPLAGTACSFLRPTNGVSYDFLSTAAPRDICADT